MKVSDKGAKFISTYYQNRLDELEHRHDPGWIVVNVLKLTREVEADLDDYLNRGWITQEQRTSIWNWYEECAQNILDDTDEDYFAE